MIKGNIRTRLDDDIGRTVGKLISETGWSESNAVNILVRAGLLAVTGDPTAKAKSVTLDAIRSMISSTIAANATKPGREKRLL